MINSMLPLANWGMGTALIIFFAVLCIVLTAIVLNFVLGNKKKDDDDVSSPNDSNL